MKICNDCPRKCGAIRTEKEGNGFCGVGTLPIVAKASIHHWEEPCISGASGSGTIFFSSCNLKCVFCQNEAISFKKKGKMLSVDELISLYQELEGKGACNINLVTAGHFTDAIVESLSRYQPSVPVLYNSSGFEEVETLGRLSGLVDVYLPDLKYIDSRKAKRYANAENYFEVASTAIEEMVRQTGKPYFNEDGLIERGTIVRHLILPENTNDAIRILDWLEEQFGDTILVSVMGQYVPCGKARQFQELSRKITKREYQKVEEHLYSLKLDGFVQQLSSANECFIPNFDQFQ